MQLIWQRCVAAINDRLRRVLGILLLCAAPHCFAASAWVATAAEVSQVDIQTGMTIVQFRLPTSGSLRYHKRWSLGRSQPKKLSFLNRADQPWASVDIGALDYGDATLLADRSL
jgi:hypothetical protein